MNSKINQNKRLMRMRQMADYCALSRAYLYQKISEGNFPPGYTISPGIVVWEKDEIDHWIDERKQGGLQQ